ncbi:MAG: glutathione S-transferase C-terminal domain-containing protein, partial [Pseudomonadota bacterium]
HSDDEIFELGKMDVDAISDALGDNDFILGANPCGYDASIYATIAGISTTFFDCRTGEYARQNPRLMSYIDRMKNKYF